MFGQPQTTAYNLLLSRITGMPATMDQQDTLTAQIAVKKGFLSKDQLSECETVLSSEEDGKHLLDVALDKGFLTQFQGTQITKEAEQTAQRQDPIPGFKLVSELGRGGMGKVYKARQLSLNRDVAIKVLPAKLAKTPGYIERFQREARSAGQLVHPNVVQVIQIGETEQKHHYIVMEFVDGPTVQALMKERKRLPEGEAVEIMRQVAMALREAHRLNLIHRDIKPANIILTKSGISKLADFGLAREEEDNSVTQTGIMMGTPHYMSPEQARAQKDLDIRSDIYSLGATLYHMVVGEVPFVGETATAIILKHLEEDPVPPKERNPEISDGLNAVILNALSKDKEDRFESPEAMLHALEDLETAASTLMTISNSAVAGSNAPTVAATLSDRPTLPDVRSARTSKVKMLYTGAAGCLSMLVLFILVAALSNNKTEPSPEAQTKVEPLSKTAGATSASGRTKGQGRIPKPLRKGGAPDVPPEDIAPPEPPTKKNRIDELFHGTVAGYLPRHRLVRLKYDFTNPDQMKDWEVTNRADRRVGDMFAVVEGNLKLKIGAIMAHKAIFEKEVVFEVEMNFAPAVTFAIGGKEHKAKDKTEILVGWSTRLGKTFGMARIGAKLQTYNLTPPDEGDPISYSIMMNGRNIEVNFDGQAHAFPQMPQWVDTRGRLGIIAPAAKLKDLRPLQKLKKMRNTWALTIKSVIIKGALTEEFLEHATRR